MSNQELSINSYHFKTAPTLDQLNTIRKSGFRPNIVTCLLYESKILFLYKKEYNLWMLPQGGIDNEENPEEAVVREMKEELGDPFVEQVESDPEYVCSNVIEFPPQTRGNKDLETDGGKEVFMKGKVYFFYAWQTPSDDLDIEKTEFDDFKWLEFNNAVVTASKIYQKGKQRITTKALFALRDKIRNF